MSCVVRVMDAEYYQSRKQVVRFSLELGVHVAGRAICWRAYTVSSTGRRGIYIGIVYKTSNFSMVEERWALVKLGIVAAV